MRKDSRNAKYIVIDHGVDFRTISKVMTGLGYKMNHATARNKSTMAIQKLLTSILEEVQGTSDTANIETLMKDKNVHNTLSEILFAAFKQELQEHTE